MGKPARAEEALAIYLAMGPSRSLAKLIRTRAEDGPEKPWSISTLKDWSRLFRWQEKAAAHDAEVAGRVREKAAEAEVDEQVSAIEGLRHGITMLSRALQDAVGGAEVAIHSPQDARAVVSAVVEASRHLQLLEGEALPQRTVEEIEAELRQVQAALDKLGYRAPVV